MDFSPDVTFRQRIGLFYSMSTFLLHVVAILAAYVTAPEFLYIEHCGNTMAPFRTTKWYRAMWTILMEVLL